MHKIEGAEPVYEVLPGWSESVSGHVERSRLPDAARRYLDRVEALTGLPIEMIGVGPERTQTLVQGQRA